MSLRQFILLIGLGTLVAWAGWTFMVWNTDPTEATVFDFFLFYLTLFTALVGTLTLFGVLFRVQIAKRKDVVLREVRIAFRHALLLSGVAVAALAFSAHGSFRWWILILLLVVVSALEYVFLLRESSGRR